MQPLRINNLAAALYRQAGLHNEWSTLPGDVQDIYRERAKIHAAILLGGEPDVSVEYGARDNKSGKISGPYKVLQSTAGGFTPMIREKWVYPAAAFVTKWVEV